MSMIEKIIASVERLHGGEREQTSKYSEYLSWLDRNDKPMRRFPMPARPASQSEASYEETFGIPSEASYEETFGIPQ